MSERVIKIHNKSVQLSQPYKASISELVGREGEMGSILAAWMAGSNRLPLSPLLLGEPGLGKNRIVYECARICTKELYIFQGHEDVSAEDLICAVRFSDDPDKKMDYIVSPLVTAMLRGGICFIDEIGKIRARALAPLASLLDERRYLDSTLLGERIDAHPGFRFIAAANTTDMDGKVPPDFIRSRMRPVITVGYPSREAINQIVQTRYPVFREHGACLLERFWDLWREKHGEQSPTPRDSINIFGFALNLADSEATEHTCPRILENREVYFTVEERHIERAFAAFLTTWQKGKDSASRAHDTVL